MVEEYSSVGRGYSIEGFEHVASNARTRSRAQRFGQRSAIHSIRNQPHERSRSLEIIRARFAQLERDAIPFLMSVKDLIVYLNGESSFQIADRDC
jgi:hypothetical protein